MADGATHFTPRTDARQLSGATAARSSLWARCRCGRAAQVDPEPWIAQGLARVNIEVLEERLRCVCGARRVPLEIRGLSEPPPGAGGRIWLFR
jgi:hypothetical protein